VAEAHQLPSSERSARRNELPRSLSETGPVHHDFNAILNPIGIAEREFSLKPSFRIVAWLAGASLLVVLGVSVSFWTFRQIEETAAIRQHSNAIISSATGFLSSLKDAETGQRGYLLTGDESYLEPYLAERENVKRHLQQLQQNTLLGDALKHLALLPTQVDARLALMAKSIEMFHNKNVTGALDVVRSGQGKQLMDSIRAEMSGFIVLEQGLLAQREAEFQSDMHRMFGVIVGSSVFTLLFALAFAWLLYRETQQRFTNLIHLETQRSLS